ncbi:hypothetical protein Poli38472_004305 [Pythium oligandrum]|uniref:RNA helicase n=1 Tax=Pythium oligandrum TaxID=41045 RepID=A0A8K1FJY1_PYTOL|nr:hypothetical protein Poli38472_004305 [Pythium oligandrum]|eukprot:TMW66540.1 hypothetical protein Poli38472_004305 [Pythium oligandrum]
MSDFSDDGVSEITAYAVVDGSSSAAKRAKKRKKRAQSGVSANGWQKVDLDDVHVQGFEDGCAYELEELTDYTIQKSETGAQILVIKGNKVEVDGFDEENAVNEQPVSDDQPKKKKKRSKKKKNAKAQEEADAEKKEEAEPVEEEEENVEMDEDEVEEAETAAPAAPVKPVNLPKWARFKLHPRLLQSLHECGFTAPTPIQEKTIYPALVDNRDIVGAAPTGSGKTLAFGLPILSQLLREKEQRGYVMNCKVLILTPTRELALQIQHHLEKMVPNREIGIVSLVGGMSMQKQMRVLSYSPEIVIGTPGRLWDLIDSNNEHLDDLNATLRFLVIDEADRMLQTGSYPEVEKIFDVLRKGKGKRATDELADLSEEEDESDEEDEGDDATTGEVKVTMLDDVLRMHQKQQEQQASEEGDEDDEEEATQVTPVRRTRQTFLFSATLTIPEGGRFQKGPKKHRHALTVLESVMKRVGLRGKPAVVDMSIDDASVGPQDSEAKRKRVQDNVALSLPAGLELCQHEVTEDSRDSYLYYFLTQYPGKTIVFLNAIHQVRKLANLLGLLRLPVFALHAEMQQRQRLKKLDGFRSNPNGILIATDVAARGLDIPSVDYVVHYHIARSTEVFLHRSGRTARANKEGLSISLVSPADSKYHAQICKMLQRPTGLSDFPFDHRFLPTIDERLRLAKGINDHENVTSKAKSEETWFSQMAKEADLDLDDNLLSEIQSKKDKGASRKGKNGESVESMRMELSRLLTEPLRPIGSVRKFRQLYQEIGSELTTDGEYRKRNASDDLVSKSKKSFKRFRRRK